MKRNKMITSILLCGALTVCSIVPVFAEADSAKVALLDKAQQVSYSSETAGGATMTEIVKSVKGKLSIPAEYTQFTSDVYETEQGKMYSLRWSVPDEGNKAIYAEVNAKNDILHYYNSGSDQWGQVGISKFTDAEILAKAESWIKTVNPTWVSELDFDGKVGVDTVHSSAADVVFKRVINGIEFCGNNANISVDKYTGEVIGMSSNWNYASNIPSLENVIPKEKINELFEKDGAITLKYVKADDSKEAILVYSMDDQDWTINGFTGELVTDEEKYSEFSSKNASASGAASNENGYADAEAQLSEQELAEIQQMSNLIPKEKAESIAKSLENTGLSTYKVTSTRYYKETNRKDAAKSKYLVSIQLEKNSQKAEDYAGASVTLDAVSGELQSMYAYVYNSVDNQKYTPAQMKTKADSFMKKYGGAEGSKVAYFGEEPEHGYISYSQSVDGIQYDGNSISVNVDAATGLIVSYNKYWDSDVTFASKTGVISVEDAKKAIIDKLGFALKYRMLYENESSTSKETPTPVYSVDADYFYIDAKTGNALGYGLKEYGKEDVKNMPTDLEKHFSKTAVETLIKTGIIVMPEGETAFNPNETITQAQALEWVGALTYRVFPLGDSKITEIYSWATGSSIIDASEKNPTALVTREKAVEYILRSKGSDYIRLAKLQGIYTTGYKDSGSISKGSEGYVAIAKGMGIAKGDGSGNFNPQKTVTRGEFAQMMYNYLA